MYQAADALIAWPRAGFRSDRWSPGAQAMSALNVLLVTYRFPPVGGTGVMRASSLARYLPAEGIRLDVLTTRNAPPWVPTPLCSTTFPLK